MKQLQNYVAGEWLASADCFEKRSPYGGSLVALVQQAMPAMVDRAVEAGHATVRGEWGRLLVAAQVGILRNLSARLTLETERTTHYLWGLVRNFAVDDQEVTRMQHELNRSTFLEDVHILEQQQVMLQSAPTDWRPVVVPSDTGYVQAERMLNQLLTAEKGKPQ